MMTKKTAFFAIWLFTNILQTTCHNCAILYVNINLSYYYKGD